jgi:hypothetical protein
MCGGVAWVVGTEPAQAIRQRNALVAANQTVTTILPMA